LEAFEYGTAMVGSRELMTLHDLSDVNIREVMAFETKPGVI
jgi:hypothetical protein